MELQLQRGDQASACHGLKGHCRGKAAPCFARKPVSLLPPAQALLAAAPKELRRISTRSPHSPRTPPPPRRHCSLAAKVALQRRLRGGLLGS